MASSPRYRVPFRRRREGKTDYRYRLRLLRSGLPRAVYRRTNSRVTVQLADYHPDGDVILACASSTDLRKYGWRHSIKSTPAAYLVGLLAGKRGIARQVEQAVFDIGLHAPRKGSRGFAALKGLIDAGVQVPHSPEMFPSDERIRGEHLGGDVAEEFESVRQSILEEGS